MAVHGLHPERKCTSYAITIQLISFKKKFGQAESECEIYVFEISGLKHPTDPDLKMVAIAVVKDALVNNNVMLPFNSRMDGVVMIKVKSRAG